MKNTTSLDSASLTKAAGIAAQIETLNASVVESQLSLTNAQQAHDTLISQRDTLQAELDTLMGREPQTISAKRQFSAEQCSKISEALKASWARRKADKLAAASAAASDIAPATSTLPAVTS